MLWLMRRPWMTRLQRRSVLLFPEAQRAKAWQSMIRQNRFARRFGLRILVGTVNLFLASIVLTLCFLAALRLADEGVFSVPDVIRDRAAR
jgi:hypothetical protein